MRKLSVKKRIFFVAYVVFMVLFVCYLAFSNQLVAASSPYNYSIEEVERDAISQHGDSIVYILGIPYCDASLPRVAYITGNVYKDSALASDNETDKVIDYYFVSAQRAYKVSTHLTKQERFSDYFGRPGYRVNGIYHVGTAQFPSTGMKDDLYSLFLYVREADGTTAMRQTSLVFQKDFNGLNLLEETSLPFSVLDTVIREDMDISQGAIEGITPYNANAAILNADNSQYYTIWGFGYRKGLDSALGQPYLTVTFEDGRELMYSGVYKFVRDDIVQKESDAQYLMSGCAFQVLKSDLEGAKTITTQLAMYYPQDDVALYFPKARWNEMDEGWEFMHET